MVWKGPRKVESRDPFIWMSHIKPHNVSTTCVPVTDQQRRLSFRVMTAYKVILIVAMTSGFFFGEADSVNVNLEEIVQEYLPGLAVNMTTNLRSTNRVSRYSQKNSFFIFLCFRELKVEIMLSLMMHWRRHLEISIKMGTICYQERNLKRGWNLWTRV